MSQPIQNVDSIDVVGVRNDAGIDLVVSCFGPLDGSPETLRTGIGISNARPVQGCPPPPVARNRPYVEPKLRGCMVCVANRTASRFLRRTLAVARPPDQRAAPP